jgi:virulence factor Mce-like protein
MLALATAVTGAVVLAGVMVWHAVVGAPGGPTWTAEFTNARGLLPGNDVRVGGAPVGRITSISLARNGTAVVRFRLSDRTAHPRSDATAAIEPADLLGDTYMSLAPGTAASTLHHAIATDHTVNAPRLDEVLDAFGPRVRDGLQALLVEGGLALDQRGGDLARAAVALRPALTAANGVLSEVNSQNGSLARLVPAAERAAAELDSRRSDLGPLIDDLDTTLNATARTSGALDQAVAGLPGTLARLRSTSGQLAATEAAATPLAKQLEPVAAPLGATVQGLPALIAQVKAAAPTFDQALTAARQVLVAGTPGLTRLSAAFPVLRGQAPTISALLGELDGAAPGIAQGFFVDFPDQAAESGRQPFDPFADPRRAYWRGAAVFSCEAFGVPVAPGCLTKALANLPAASPSPSGPSSPTASAPAGKTTNPPAGATARAGATANPPAGRTAGATPQAPANPTTAASQLLDFLLR